MFHHIGLFKKFVLGTGEVQIRGESLGLSRGTVMKGVRDRRWVRCGCTGHLAQTGVSQIARVEMIPSGESGGQPGESVLGNRGR